jgi:putative membrane protein
MHFFGRLLWIIITVTMMGLAVSFAVSNDAVISLSLWPLTHRLDLPIWLFGVGAFVFGGILGATLMGGQMLAIRAKLWHAQSQIKKLHKQTAPDPEKDNSLILPQTPES